MDYNAATVVPFPKEAIVSLSDEGFDIKSIGFHLNQRSPPNIVRAKKLHSFVCENEMLMNQEG